MLIIIAGSLIPKIIRLMLFKAWSNYHKSCALELWFALDKARMTAVNNGSALQGKQGKK